MNRIRFTVKGQPASKANRRRFAVVKGRVASIKSEEALAFEEGMLRQIPGWARLMLRGDCGIRLHIYYRDNRSDLDESLVLDCLQARYDTIRRANGSKERRLVQAGVVVNDRQFRQRHVYHGIDKNNPRVEICIWQLHPEAGQERLAL